MQHMSVNPFPAAPPSAGKRPGALPPPAPPGPRLLLRVSGKVFGKSRSGKPGHSEGRGNCSRQAGRERRLPCGTACPSILTGPFQPWKQLLDTAPGGKTGILAGLPGFRGVPEAPLGLGRGSEGLKLLLLMAGGFWWDWGFSGAPKEQGVLLENPRKWLRWIYREISFRPRYGRKEPAWNRGVL